MFFEICKDVFQRYEYQLFKWFTFVRGAGGGGGGQAVQAGLSYPHLGFRSNSVIS